MVVHVRLGDGRAEVRGEVPFVGETNLPHELGVGLLKETQVVAVPRDDQSAHFAEPQRPFDRQFQGGRPPCPPSEVVFLRRLSII